MRSRFTSKLKEKKFAPTLLLQMKCFNRNRNALFLLGEKLTVNFKVDNASANFKFLMDFLFHDGLSIPYFLFLFHAICHFHKLRRSCSCKMPTYVSQNIQHSLSMTLWIGCLNIFWSEESFVQILCHYDPYNALQRSLSCETYPLTSVRDLTDHWLYQISQFNL